MKREQMNFGEVLEALKAGQSVSRSGWNGKGMSIMLTKGSVSPEDISNAIQGTENSLVMVDGVESRLF